MTDQKTPPPEDKEAGPAGVMASEIPWADKAVMLITAASFVAGFAIEGAPDKMIAQLETIRDMSAAWAEQLKAESKRLNGDN